VTTRTRIALALAIVVSLTAARAAAAQAARGDASAQAPRLAEKLDRETAARVSHLIDSARAMNLPTDPLVGVALEGANRHASAERIVRAVRDYVGALRVARLALGDAAPDAEVVSGAGAVLSGVSDSRLRQLRAARPGESLTVPLVVLADLVARGVPADSAAYAVTVAARAGAKDADFTLLRRYIEQDISAGASPAAATSLRLRNVPGVRPEDLRGLPPPGAPQARRPN
jgi:hypothetical protein